MQHPNLHSLVTARHVREGMFLIHFKYACKCVCPMCVPARMGDKPNVPRTHVPVRVSSKSPAMILKQNATVWVVYKELMATSYCSEAFGLWRASL